MDSVLAHNIMFSARIREIVYLDIVLDAFPDEAETVFPYYYRVDCTLTDEKLALQILSLIDEACLCVTIRIAFRTAPRRCC